MPSLFGKKKVPIQIIKTEPLGKQYVEKGGGSEIKILGKQQLTQQFTAEELQTVADQISLLALPQIVLKAREARLAGRVDQAILVLRQYQRRSQSTPEVEEELAICLAELENPGIFQKLTNGQLAMLLFDAAGFLIEGQQSFAAIRGSLLENRISFLCEDSDVRRILELVTRTPVRYSCYSLAEFQRSLDMQILAEINANFDRRETNTNRQIYFAVCNESRPDINMHINVHRTASGYVAIPLERNEIRRALVGETSAAYVLNKVNTWMGTHRLFFNSNPISDQSEFFGREDFTQEITRWVNRGSSFYILGNRRMGKTSLIYQLKSIGAFRNCLYAYIDPIIAYGAENFDSVLESIYRQWSDDLRLRNRKIGDEIILSLSESPVTKKLTGFLEFLKDKAKNQLSDVRCLLILEDVNVLIHADNGDEATNLWKHGAQGLIKMLHQWPDLVILGLTVWDFDTLNFVENTLGPASGKDTVICLGPFNKSECHKMIEEIGGIINMRFDAESLEKIYQESGGHPLWTRLLCDLISRTRHSRNESIEVHIQSVEKAAEEFVAIEKRHLLLALESLEITERRLVESLSRSGVPLTLDECVNKTRLNINQVKERIPYLQRYGWVEALPDGCYTMRMNLFARYFGSQNLEKTA